MERDLAALTVRHEYIRVARENEMRAKTLSYFAFVLCIVSALSFSACSKLSGPSDAEAIKAISESGALQDLNLQSPIVVMEKGRQKTDGSWPVKIKIKFTYEIKKGQMSAPVEKTPVYFLVKSKDVKGHSMWKVKF
jgi:hypothetical protein